MGELFVMALGSAGGAWALLCAFSPDYPCGRCAGTGQRTRMIGRGTLDCRACEGVGRRRRIGARPDPRRAR